ncbi:hypothetical protein V5N11_014438 [Cardamine amara subsp. amara]|uniref:Uncharacterized protein n=1 Tax=Cardamine amara subsp. amara TaxID=228776 RepID=A0ABD1ALD6_CARAN
MYTREPPWPFEDSKDIVPLLLNGKTPKIPESLPWDARQFIQTCFTSNPGSFAELLKHTFLQKVSDQNHVRVTGAGYEKKSVVVLKSEYCPKKTLKIKIVPPKPPQFKKISNRPLRLKIIPPKPPGCNLVPVQ